MSTSAVPLVSVVIPAYNAERTIRQTVESVLTQTVEDLELLVVDDGSQDGTPRLVNAVPDPRVHLIRQPNGGAAKARNTGIEHAIGRWVAFLDADDLWVPTKLATQLDALAADPTAHAAYSSAYIVDDNMRVLEVRSCFQPEHDLLTFLRFQNMAATASTLIVRRDAFAEVGAFVVEYQILEDWDMLIKLVRLGRVISITEPLAFYRQHPGNSSRNLDIHIDAGVRILQRLFADPTVPEDVRRHRREIYARFYTMLCGGSLRSHRYGASAYWGVRALASDPRMAGYIAAMPLRRSRRVIHRLRSPG